jgi:hypothetical protein
MFAMIFVSSVSPRIRYDRNRSRSHRKMTEHSLLAGIMAQAQQGARRNFVAHGCSNRNDYNRPIESSER